MDTYSLPSGEYTLLRRIRKELALFLYLQIILIIFFGIDVTLEASLILMYLLMMTLRRNRLLYFFSFDDEKQTLEIKYFHLIFFRKHKIIPYSKLKTRISLKRFGLGNQVKTLETLQEKQLIGEIRMEGKWRWSEETFDNIAKKMEKTGAL